MVRSLDDILQSVIRRLDPGKFRKTPTEQADGAPHSGPPDRLEILLRQVGARYRNATLDNYEASNDLQKAALARLRAYAANLRDEVRAGRGILLFGTTGTGKDHLLIGLARNAIAAGCPLLWVNGVDLQARMREAIRTETSEDRILACYEDARVLVLSDPLPPAGSLTDYQAATLYRLVDHRYRNLLPIWCSLNVADANEARQRLGAATVDRLRDGALALECKWPSYRRARQ